MIILLRIWLVPMIWTFLVFGCAAVQPSPSASTGTYEQLKRSEVYRVGTVVSRTPEGVQVQLDTPERVVIQEKGLVGEVAQEIMDRRGLLPVRIVRVYMEGEPIAGGERPKVDITDRVKVVYSDRDRLTFSMSKETVLTAGQKLYFKSEMLRLALLDMTAGGSGSARDVDVIMDDLTSTLANTSQFIVLERARIKAILDEYQFAQHGLIDPKTAPKIGHLLGAEAIMTGTVLHEGRKSVVNMRVINVERGEVILAIRKEFQKVETLPKMVRTSPENGAKNVPTTLKEIVIVFDQAMSSNWYVSRSPYYPDQETHRKNVYWRDDRTVVMRMISTLNPNQTYSVTINAGVGTSSMKPGEGFRGLNQQTPIPSQRFFFTTGE